MAKRKYDYFNVATPSCDKNFEDYHEALKFYGKSEKPSTIYGVVIESNDYVTIKAK